MTFSEFGRTLAETLAERAKRYAHPGAYLRAAHDEALRGALGRVGWGRAEVATSKSLGALPSSRSRTLPPTMKAS